MQEALDSGDCPWRTDLSCPGLGQPDVYGFGTESTLGSGHHLYPHMEGLPVSRCRSRRLKSPECGMGNGQQYENRLGARCAEDGDRTTPTRRSHPSLGSGLAVHVLSIRKSMFGRRHCDHGRTPSWSYLISLKAGTILIGDILPSTTCRPWPMKKKVQARFMRAQVENHPPNRGNSNDRF